MGKCKTLVALGWKLLHYLRFDAWHFMRIGLLLVWMAHPGNRETSHAGDQSDQYRVPETGLSQLFGGHGCGSACVVASAQCVVPNAWLSGECRSLSTMDGPTEGSVVARQPNARPI